MPNDKQIDVLWRTVNKQGKYIEQLEKKQATQGKEVIKLKNLLESMEVWWNSIEFVEKYDIN